MYYQKIKMNSQIDNILNNYGRNKDWVFSNVGIQHLLNYCKRLYLTHFEDDSEQYS